MINYNTLTNTISLVKLTVNTNIKWKCNNHAATAWEKSTQTYYIFILTYTNTAT